MQHTLNQRNKTCVVKQEVILRRSVVRNNNFVLTKMDRSKQFLIFKPTRKHIYLHAFNNRHKFCTAHNVQI